MEVSPLDRFEDSSGSGRAQIYTKIFDGVMRSSFGSLLFGHGFYATSDYTKQSLEFNIAVVAHNDWLEVAYDFGLVGLILYLSILLSILRSVIKSERRESNLLLITLAIFLVRTSFSMVYADKGSVIYYLGIGLIFLDGLANKSEKQMRQ